MSYTTRIHVVLDEESAPLDFLPTLTAARTSQRWYARHADLETRIESIDVPLTRVGIIALLKRFTSHV